MSDGNERADYDRYGADGPQMRQRRGGGGGGGYHAHGDIDPEDIFNMFFGMQPQRRQQGRTYVYQQGQQRQRQQQHHQGGGGGGNYAQLVQLMPLLLLFLFSFLGNQAGRNDLPFRLQRTPPEYTFRRETASTGTPYYVKGDFEKLFGNRNKVSSSCSSCVPAGSECVQLGDRVVRATSAQLQQVEKEVDKHYLNNLMNECRREKVSQRQMMQEAR